MSIPFQGFSGGVLPKKRGREISIVWYNVESMMQRGKPTKFVLMKFSQCGDSIAVLWWDGRKPMVADIRSQL